MEEATFPLLGTAFVVLVVLPVFALLAKAGLVMIERDDIGGPLHGLNLRYVLLTSSSGLPLAWLLSAGLQQVKTGKSALACLFDHDAAELCLEPGFFALVLGSAIFPASLWVLRQHRRPRISSCDTTKTLLGRVERIVETNPALACLCRGVLVTDDSNYALGTHGWIAPRVFIGSAYARSLSDEMLASALGHEAEHVRALDPLRYVLLQVALAVNPFGRFLLAPHVARWQAVREAHCDREAVIQGAAPLSLADAIVRAARPSAREAVALGASNNAVLKFRIGMLLAFAERAPARCCRRGLPAFPLALVLLLIAVVLPHQAGTAALDVLHSGSEHAFSYVWR